MFLEYQRSRGVHWTARPTKSEVQQEYERIWRQIGGRSIEELRDLPPMTDPKWRATMDVLTKAQTPASFIDQNLQQAIGATGDAVTFEVTIAAITGVPDPDSRRRSRRRR